jgi:anti-sigma factor RsiW
MRCSRVEQLLPAYLDGDLPLRLSQRVLAHLDKCPRCRQQEEAEHQSHRALDSGRHSLSIDLWADFSRRLQAEAPPRPSPWRLLWQPGLASALAALVVTLVARSAPAPPVSSDVVPPVRVARLAQVAQAPAPAIGIQPLPSHRRLLRPSEELTRRAKLAAGPRRASGGESEAAAPMSSDHTGRIARRRTAAHRVGPSQPLFSDEQSEHPSQKKGRTGPLRMASITGRAAPDSAMPRPVALASVPAASDPLDVAEALVTVQQDAANDQMRRELLLMAGEVARVGGESAAAAAPDPTGT